MVKDSDLNLEMAYHLIEVGIPQLMIDANCPTESPTFGVYYTYTLTATGGNGNPFVWSLIGGSFPDGITLSSDGIISGTASSIGTFDWTARVTDGSQMATIMCEFILALEITTACPVVMPEIGVPYSYTLEVSGGAPPYTWALISGAFPDGITLDSATGEISGTATESGTFTWTIRVTDNLGNTAEITCEFIIVPVIDELMSTCPDEVPELDVAYSDNVTVTGGVPPYTFELIAGAFPDGLSLDPDTGIISGTPTETGTFDFTIRVTDSVDSFVDDECEFVISEGTTGVLDIIYAETSPRLNGSNNPDILGALLPQLFILFNGVMYKSRRALPQSGAFQTWTVDTIPAGNWVEFGFSNVNLSTVCFGNDAFVMTKAVIDADPTDQPWTKYSIPVPLKGCGGLVGPSGGDLWSPPGTDPALLGAINGTTVYGGEADHTNEQDSIFDYWAGYTSALGTGAWNVIMGAQGTIVNGGNTIDDIYVIGEGNKVLRWFDAYGDTSWVQIDCPDGKWVSTARYSDFSVAVGTSDGTFVVMASTDACQTWGPITPPVGWTPINPKVVFDLDMYVITVGHVNDTQGTFVVCGGTIDGTSAAWGLPLREDDTFDTPVVFSLPSVPGVDWKAIGKNYAYEGILIVGNSDGSAVSILSNPEGLTAGSLATYDDWELRTTDQTPFA